MSSAFDEQGLARLAAVVDDHVAKGTASEVSWAVARLGEVRTGGTGDDRIYRIASMTKPVTAVATMTMVEECRLRLDDPVDDLLPELADRQVLVPGATSLDQTVPAERAVTLRDLLTFRLGLGMDFTFPPQLGLQAMDDRGIGVGPPDPSAVPEPDEWMRRLGEVPLEHQPGERWLYHTSADVLGVLLARADGRPLEEVFRERVFAPLGMEDTAFSVPAGKLDRLGPCENHAGGAVEVFDPPNGQWASPPAFPSAGAGLVSTIHDYLAFALMFRGGGTHRGARILSRPTVELMTTDLGGGPEPTTGWGFGVGVQRERVDARSVGTYGWDGGLGSMWCNDPVEDLTVIVLTSRVWDSPSPPVVIRDIWTAAYAAVA